jgi:hypothetical protein
MFFDELCHHNPSLRGRWLVVSPLLVLALTRPYRVTKPVGA